jgi:hypothetical protein
MISSGLFNAVLSLTAPLPHPDNALRTGRSFLRQLSHHE